MNDLPRKHWTKELREGKTIRVSVFLSKFTQGEGCWLWKGATNGGGYGTYGMANAHRIAYIHFVEPIPEGMHVLHRCDNPPCVNPDHLFLGTRKDNMQDAKSKNRMVMPPRYEGSQHPESKLQERDVIAMRSEYAEGMAKRALARKYGINKKTVKGIVEYTAWRHV